MSVWKGPVYRDAAFQASARAFGVNNDSKHFLKRLLNFDIEDPGDFELPNNLKAGNLKEQLDLRDEDAVRIMSNLASNNLPLKHDILLKHLNSYNQVIFGLPSVFRFFKKVYKKAERSTEYPFDDRFFVRGIYTAGSFIGKHSPVDARSEFDKMVTTMEQKPLYLIKFFRDLVRVANSFKLRKWMQDSKTDDAIYGLKTKASKALKVQAVFPMQNVIYIADRNRLFVLTRDDINRLDKLMNGSAYAILYYNHYGRMDRQDRNKVLSAHNRYVDMILDAIPALDFKKAQFLCRACDVAYNILLAAFSTDVSDHSLQDQLAKVQREGLNRIIDVVGLANTCRNLPMKDALEVMLFYKILPQADYDYFGAANRQVNLYKKQNIITDKMLFDHILRHHKLLMIQAFHSRHGYCPGMITRPDVDFNWTRNFPHVSPSVIKPSEVDYIDLKGAFVYQDHNLDCWDLVKDKAICPLEIDKLKNQGDLQRLSKEKKNQLLDFLKRDKLVSVANLRDKFDTLFMDIKCDDKAEAKKPDGRWFMEAHTDVRLVLSEYEASIAEYGKHLAGFMQGKGIAERQKMMNYVTEYTEVLGKDKYLYISFDIEKWSPRLPVIVHEALDKQWAEAFGFPFIAKASKIFTDGYIHYIRGPIHHKFMKQGNDFEGFAGKKLTFYHLAVMHAAVESLYAQKLIYPDARYAAQIDDGVLRVKSLGEPDAEYVNKLRKALKVHWDACGANISWDKTFISAAVCVFLNDIRVQSRSINSGIRAFLKITNLGEAIVPSILDDAGVLESTVRGAIVAGSTLLVAYFVYCFLVHDLLQKWSKNSVQFMEKHVCWIFSPVGLGGLGIANLMSLMGSLDFDAFQTGLANVAFIGKVFPGLEPVVDRILNQDMQVISEITSVNSPTSIRRSRPIFRNDRLTVLMRRSFSGWFSSPVLYAYALHSGVELAHDCVTLISKTVDCPVECRELWYDSSPLAFVDALVRKILTARTAVELLPRRALFRTTVSNYASAKIIIEAW